MKIISELHRKWATLIHNEALIIVISESRPIGKGKISLFTLYASEFLNFYKRECSCTFHVRDKENNMWNQSGCHPSSNLDHLYEFWQLTLSKWGNNTLLIIMSWALDILSIRFSSLTQLCPTLCDPMNHSTPGFPVHHQLTEFTQTHVHRVNDALQPSLPLSSPSPPAPNPSQHQSLFQWVNSSHEVAKVTTVYWVPTSYLTCTMCKSLLSCPTLCIYGL